MEVAKAELKLDKSSRKVQPAMVRRAVLGALIVAAPAALIVSLLSSLAALLLEPTYEPSARLVVDFQPQGEKRMYLAGGNRLRSEESQMLTQVTMRTAASRPVAEETIRRLRLEIPPEDLLHNLRVEQSGNMNIVILTYEGTDRRDATRIANTLGEVTSEAISERSAVGRRVVASVEEARVPERLPEPKPLSTLRHGLLTLAVVWGLLAGSTLALLAVMRH